MNRTTNSPKVLLIDDSEAFRAAIAAVLRREGMEIVEARDGREAYAAATAEQPDLVLLDLNLPEKDGFEILKDLKQDYATRAIPVAFLSSIDCAADKVNGLNLGAVDYLIKAVDHAELVARIRAALRNKSERDALERRALLDGLTGLANRYALEERLPSDWAQSRRQGSSLAVLIADLDRFKTVNDRFGHQAGDRLIQSTARAMRDAVRGGDFLARYGGDEFLVLARDCGLIGAIAIAERLRLAMASMTEGPVRGTVSVGVALDEPGDAGPEAALGRADSALYHAKAFGRDAVWAYERGGFRPAGSMVREADLSRIGLGWAVVGVDSR